MPRDETPADIAEIRRQRERRRLWRGFAAWFLWFAVFTAGCLTGSLVLQWSGFALFMADLAVMYGLYEKSLRWIAGRPAADYRRIRKLEKRELPERKKERRASGD